MVFRRIDMCLRMLWQQLRVTLRLVVGLWKLSKMPEPIVSIFGGSKMLQSSPYAHKASLLGKKLVEHGISVLTGGGPGIMQAANCGASNGKHGEIRTMGIGVKGLSEEHNLCTEDYIAMNDFYSRKLLLTHYSVGFAVFPGGFGTLDELTGVATLIGTHQLRSVPIVLIGIDYWKPFMAWIDSAAKHGLLKERDKNIIVLTDDVEEAVHVLVKRCREHKTKK